MQGPDLALIDREAPGLVFLDVDLPGGNAFDLLARLDQLLDPADPLEPQPDQLSRTSLAHHNQRLAQSLAR